MREGGMENEREAGRGGQEIEGRLEHWRIKTARYRRSKLYLSRG